MLEGINTVAARGAEHFADPMTVVASRALTTDEKRALLASWASDARAVRDRPSLRRLDSGTLVHIDDVLDALKSLDKTSSPAPDNLVSLLGRPSRSGAWIRLPLHDDGDDPPPAAAQRRPLLPPVVTVGRRAA